MIDQVATHLMRALVAAGVPARQVVRGASELARIAVLPRAIVHFRATEERLTRDGTLVGWETSGGVRVYRRRLYRRDLEVLVQVDAKTHAEAEALLMTGLVKAGRGTVDERGQWIAFGDGQVGRAEETSQARACDSAILTLLAVGGLYEDTDAHVATEMTATGSLVQEL